MIIGIDPSLTATGICWGDTSPRYKLMHSKATSPEVKARITRFDKLAQEIATFCRPIMPSAIYIEGYSFGSQGAGKISTVEFGGLLRFWLLRKTDVDPIEVPPKTLKLFFTGNGNAPKINMRHAAQVRYAQPVEDENLIDAFALWRLGCLDRMAYPDLIDEIEAAGFDHYQDKRAAKKK